jgi:Mg-chelatase subunit ChlD
LNASGSLDFAFLFDFSGSRKNDPKFHDEFAEAGDFLRRIWQGGDVATIVAFNDGAHVVMPATPDVNRAIQVMNSLSGLSPNGGTALFDAICSAVIDPNSAPASRKVVLIFSDFDDDSSRNTEQQGIDCTSKGKVPIYSFVILNEHSEHREMRHDVKTAREFSENSGGVAFDTKSASELPDSLSQLSQFLRSSYEVSFNTSPAKAGKHPVPIDVETTRPGITLYFARHYYKQ